MAVFVASTAIQDEKGDWHRFLAGDEVPVWAGKLGAHIASKGVDTKPEAEPAAEPEVEADVEAEVEEPDFTTAPKRRTTRKK